MTVAAGKHPIVQHRMKVLKRRSAIAVVGVAGRPRLQEEVGSPSLHLLNQFLSLPQSPAALPPTCSKDLRSFPEEFFGVWSDIL